MKTFKPLILLTLSVLFLIACASNSDREGRGDYSGRSGAYSMGGFTSSAGEPLRADSKYDAIEVYNGVELELIKSSNIHYKVEADKSVLSRVKVLVRGDKLCIYTDSLKHIPKIKVTLWGPVPESLSVWNGATLVCNDALSMKELELRAWNNGNITFGGNLSITDAEFSAWNNASVTLRGALRLNEAKASAWNNGSVVARGTLSATELNARAWNNGELKMTGRLTLGELEASAWTNGVLNLPAINAKSVEAEAHTNGYIKIGGTSGRISVSRTTGGEVDTSALKGLNSGTPPAEAPLPPV